MPEVLATDKVILDVGCGIGQTLVAMGLDNSHTLVGIDIEHESLLYGHQHFDNVEYTLCNAESLPFASDSFDLVISRVALPYTNIPATLAEMQRVLKPGGRLWITLHPQKMTWLQLGSSIKNFRYKDVIFRSYVLLNGLSFHSFGKLFHFPLKPDRYESFQTAGGMKRGLLNAEFTQICLQRDRHFLVTAKKAD